MVFPLYDLLLALPEIILSVVVLLLVLAAAFGGQGAKNTRRVTRYALVGVTLALIIIWYGTNTGDVAFSGMYIADNFATYMKILVLLGVFFALLLSIKSLSNEDITKPE